MRKTVLGILLLSLAAWGCRGDKAPGPAAGNGPQAAPAAFVTVRNGRFMLSGRPYYFAGANFWQGMNLAVDGPSGDRPRLLRELDRLRDLGITNLRVMASSEGPDTEPFRMVPALMTRPGEYNGSVLDGLDFLLAEMGKRGQRAVMVLNNFWQWSGGMAQYVSWQEKTPIPYPGDYPKFIAYSARFYGYPECQDWFRDHIAMIVGRTNPYTGLKYRDDPAVFSWELANEPRRSPQSWIDETSAYIRSLDPNHMVTTGSEGAPPEEKDQDFIRTHGSPGIDYATIHIWPQNWGWYDPRRPASYKAKAEPLAIAYFRKLAGEAQALGKPLVLEEFGLARDWATKRDNYNPASTTATKDLYYAALYRLVEDSIAAGGPVMGDNFWAWAGEARPGGLPWVGDPPHEPAGWYSVYDADASTIAVIAGHAKKLAELMK
ncbi:MAG TPA: mannanase [Candidatus Aminicenantes bacterium]|nr:mannanase [Candidatus Aminicenantes bacterium]HRY65441.1 mannanase [Candidatus Aminicenantes bacterium]HRZ72091.1 mannanase [Candidatus Aminicenantes bacterium]